METILEITLLLAGPEETIDDLDLDDEEEGIELEKRLDLPFVPTENLDLLLPGAREVLETVDEDEMAAMAEWVTISPELASGVFHISRVAFDIEHNRFLAETDSIQTQDATPSDIENFAQYLVKTFGFTRREADDEDEA